jgi:hypothetical protein
MEPTEQKESTENTTSIKEPAVIKHHRKWPWVVGILIVIFIIAPILVIGWLGFMPGVSSWMGATKPVDLGVKYTAADYASYQIKTGGQFLDYVNAPDNPAKPGKKLVFADPKFMDVSLTQEEITATLNSIGWEGRPLTNTQVRLSNGAIEVSGNLNTGRIYDFVNLVGGVGYDQGSINKALSWAKRLGGTPPVYIKANVSAVSNSFNLNIVSVKVGRISAPKNVAQKVLSSGTNSAVSGLGDRFNAQSLTIQNGSLQFIGTSPTSVYVKKN